MDIFWLGRQWAVTGFGIQAVNHKLDMRFDVPVSRIWEEGLIESMLEQEWFDIEDFAQALSIARKRHQGASRVIHVASSEK